MCGRFVRYSKLKDVADEFGAEEPSFDLEPSYNIAPTHDIAVITGDGKKKIIKCRWGFIPSWAKNPKIAYKMINARSETVADKPSFKNAFRKNRIIIPANGFYEWKKEGKSKTPLYIQLKSQRPIGLAGLLSVWTDLQGEKIYTCSIITTGANSALLSIHDRMPVIIEKKDEDSWLNRNADKKVISSLLRPYNSEEMEYYEVAGSVNSPAHNNPDCIKPIDRNP